MHAQCPTADDVRCRNAGQDVVGHPRVGSLLMLMAFVLCGLEELDRSGQAALDGGRCAPLNAELHPRSTDSSPARWMPSSRTDASRGSRPIPDRTSASLNSTTR